MYHSELNPLKKITRKSEAVKTPRSGQQRKLHKAFLRYHDPKNWDVLRRPINMGFCGKVHNNIRLVLGKYTLDCINIANIHLLECISVAIFNRDERL
jgi:radical SAM superfamily enzyme YgiQ (UPF0313 family)